MQEEGGDVSERREVRLSPPDGEDVVPEPRELASSPCSMDLDPAFDADRVESEESPNARGAGKSET